MTPAARVQASIEVLDAILDGQPAEQALTRWARASRFAGSKDRAAVRDHVFDALRCLRSFAARGGALSGRGLMLGAIRAAGLPEAALFDGSPYGPAAVAPHETGRDPEPGAEAGDIPDWLWPEFADSLGAAAQEAAVYLQARAPVFIRVNTRRMSRNELREVLEKSGISAVESPISDTALEVTAGARQLRGLPAFSEGVFEFQDAASQAVVNALTLEAGWRVLDYCAGGGGKTLAMAARADCTFFAHDADPGRMADLPTRAARAGAAVRIVDAAAISDVAPFDLVLCDVPCSGSGSWRRAPQGKWSLTADGLARLVELQAGILRKAADLVRPGGTLAYVTCSVLARENSAQVETFLQDRPEWRCTEMRSWPLSGGGDGFFLSTLTRV